MKCPDCGSDDTRTMDSRRRDGGTYRRKVCRACDFRFSTRELHVEEVKLLRNPPPPPEPEIVEAEPEAPEPAFLILRTIRGILDQWKGD